MVPDFIIIVYGSSCNSLFFGFIFSSFLLDVFLGTPHSVRMPINRKRKQRSEKGAEKEIIT